MGDWENLDLAFKELEGEIEAVSRGLTVFAWNSILMKTPQFEGRMAASWEYSIGAPVYVNRSVWVGRDQQRDEVEGPVRGLFRGHPVAIGIANGANVGHDASFKLGDTVFIANGVDHGEGPYAQDIEDGNVRLRPWNLPGQPVQRTLDRIQALFGENVSVTWARRLKNMRIGDAAGSDS